MVEKTIKIREDLDNYMKDFAEEYRKQGHVSYYYYYGSWNNLIRVAVDLGLLVCDSKTQEITPTCLARMLYDLS